MAHRVGVLGLGLMGRRMLAALSAHPAFEVTRTWDTAAAARAGAHSPAARDAPALTGASDVDAVYVATPPASHAGYARAALAAGKAVLCEKPLVVDLEEGRQLVAGAAGAPQAVNFPFATDPAVAALERRLRSGEAGELRRVEIRLHFPEWPRSWQRGAAWLAGRAEGGFLREVFSHFAYLTQRLLGPLRIRSAHVGFPERAAETSVRAELEAGGVPIVLTGEVGGRGRDTVQWTVSGSRASLRLADWGVLLRGEGSGWRELPTDAPPSDPFAAQLDAFAALLRGEPHPLPDFAAGLAVAEVVEGLLASAATRARSP